MGYEAFKLSDDVRERLKEAFPPKFPEFIGHHITHRFGVQYDPSFDNPAKSTIFTVVGYAEEDGLEALVVESSSGSIIRPDGKIYHITWSLDREKGKKPVDSNNLIANGYRTVDPILLFTSFAYFQ